MKLIFTLGNYEKAYNGTRHNIGFAVTDALAEKHSASFVEKGKLKAYIAELRINGEKVLLAKPTTFYNMVGNSYRSIVDFYKIAPADVLVVHDELALPFGTLRTRLGGSDAGNNGIKSVNQQGGSETTRLRIGIANEHRAVMDDADFVLARFAKSETTALEKTIIPKCLETIEAFIAEGHEITSHTLSD